MNSQGKNYSLLLQKPLSHWAMFILPIWGFLALILLQINFPPVSHGLVGPDDYMRAVRIFDLLASDAQPYRQPRMGIPPGGEVVWSRLTDTPLLLLTILFRTFTDNTEQAFYWAATVLPLAQLALMMFILCWAVSPLTGRKRAIIALLVLMLMTKVTGEYKPGRIDHHGWQIMLMIGGYGALLRQYLDPARRRWPLIAGSCFATGFAVGADLVLWTGLTVVLSGIFWLAKGRNYEKSNLLYGAALFVLTLLFYGMFQPPSGYLVPACDVLSITYLSLAAAVPLFWSIIYVIPERFKASMAKRFILGAVFGGALLAGLYMLYPQCFTNIYGLESDILYKVWVSQDHESRPLWAHAEYYTYLTLYFTATIFLGLLASIAATIFEKEQQPLWIGFSLIMTIALTACAFHLRLVTFAQVLAIWPLCRAIAYGWERMRTMTMGIKELSIIGVICVMTLLALSGMNEENARNEAPGKVALAENTYCPVSQIAKALNQIEEQQTIITSYIFNGSEILFRTHHRVLAAPYHRNAPGIEATYKIFAAGGNEAHKLARDYDVDLVMVCPGYWPYPPEEIENENPLIRDLLMQKPPHWLEKANDIKGGGFDVYRVR